MSVDVYLNKKVGDFVIKGELICIFYSNKDILDPIVEKVKKVYIFQDTPLKDEDKFSHNLIE